MKVCIDIPLKNYGFSRIENAFRKHSGNNIEFVSEEDADFVIIYAHGNRRQVGWWAEKLLKQGKKYAVIQVAIRSTANPKTEDWLDIWKNAAVIWSYYDLSALCKEDGNRAEFNFYHAPLGVDPEIFKEVKSERTHKLMVGHSRDEYVRQCIAAAGGDVYKQGTDISDEEMARAYSQVEYVSGLRRKEGFEMPVLEGLLCGARPICFDMECYRTWFGRLTEYIAYESDAATAVPLLKEILKHKPRPVTEQEKQFVKDRFNCRKIIQGFWQAVD